MKGQILSLVMLKNLAEISSCNDTEKQRDEVRLA